jgi:two-component system chemotaxis response regulator CheY
MPITWKIYIFHVIGYCRTSNRGKTMKRVLIVDDASVVRLLIKKVLVKGGFEIVGEAVNGVDALAKYKELKPDIVTMDITMPEADGIQATKDIIAFDPNAKIVMLSGIDQKEMLWQAIKSGASSYIVKPFENDRILSTLNDVIDGK